MIKNGLPGNCQLHMDRAFMLNLDSVNFCSSSPEVLALECSSK